MTPFVYAQLPSKVLFGPGTRSRVLDEVMALGRERVMLIGSGSAASTATEAELSAMLADRLALYWTEVVQHVPDELAERAREAAIDSDIDCILTVGGGSSTGLAKAIALTSRRPIIAIPTTYAGSEQTTIYGITGERHKQTGKSADVLPKVVIYDPELTVGIPASVTGPSAFNALAHSVEALYAPGNNPITTAMALEGIRAIHRSLATVMQRPSDVEARGDLLYGAYLSGVALGQTSAAFHHKICHVLGGTFNLVHADAHSVILPHAIAFLAPALPTEMALLADALGGEPAGALFDLAVASNVPTSLAALGLAESDLLEAAERSVAEIAKIAAPGNPRPCSLDDMLTLLHNAHAGVRPTVESSPR